MNKEITLGSLFDGAAGFPYAGSLTGIKTVWASEIEPFPIRVTTKRMPSVKHYGDVSVLDGAKLEPVDIITFGSPCFPKGTLVLTDKGYIPIEKVCSGMKVLTHKGRWRKITATGSKLGETVVLKGNHYGLECTPNHPIYSSGERKYYSCLENGKHRNQIILTNEKSWISAGEMNGHLWGVPNHTDALPIASPFYSLRKEKKFPPLSEKLFYFVGRWLGNGWVRNGRRTNRPNGETYGNIFLCDSYDKEDELRRTVEGVSKRYNVSHTKTCVRIRFCSRVFAKWLTDNFGHYASEKTLPAWVFGMCESWRVALLKGLLDSDGYKVKGKECEYRISTISKKLAESIRLLGETLGYSTTVFFTKTPDITVIEGRTVSQRDYYTVELAKGKKRRHLSDNLHGWYRVRSVTPTHEVKPVYNLTVEEDNSYVADGITVHNCQDLSISGKRAGLSGSRSSLFFEAVRIIKEMRKATNGRKPEFIVWENVPGAFSSNQGEDFRCVIENICRIKEADVSIPKPKKWDKAGYVVGDGYSVAWRVLDAQYWGVPQRRKRIYLVADFGGERAGKILFESEGVSWNSCKGRETWQEVAGDIGESSQTTGWCLNDQSGDRISVSEDVIDTLQVQKHGHQSLVFENHSNDSRYKGPLSTANTVTARYGTGGNNQPLVVWHSSRNSFHTAFSNEGAVETLMATDYKDPPTVSREPEYIVRRLTPTECARLQGFPDWWCDDLGTDEPTDEEMTFWGDVFETHRRLVTHAKKPKTDNQIKKWLKNPYSDSAEYKMWGNSIAIPCALYVLHGISKIAKNN